MSSDDFEQPLTPAHLLSGHRLISLPDAIYCKDIEEDDFEVTPQLLTKRVVYLNKLLSDFWGRWRLEYLSELREAHRHRRKTSDTEAISIGDVVLIHDEGKARGFWKLGRVLRLVTGRDGHTRGAVLKIAAGSAPEATLQRPLQRLYPLEIHSNSRGEESDDVSPEDSVATTDEVVDGAPVQSSPSKEESAETGNCDRPRQAAATRARDWAKAVAMYEQDN